MHLRRFRTAVASRQLKHGTWAAEGGAAQGTQLWGLGDQGGHEKGSLERLARARRSGNGNGSRT